MPGNIANSRGAALPARRPCSQLQLGFAVFLADGQELVLGLQKGVDHIGIEVTARLFENDRAGGVMREGVLGVRFEVKAS